MKILLMSFTDCEIVKAVVAADGIENEEDEDIQDEYSCVYINPHVERINHTEAKLALEFITAPIKQ